MKCTKELVLVPYRVRSLYEALHPTEPDLATHPRSSMYIRNCFFKRLDTITIETEPKDVRVKSKLMMNIIEALLIDAFDTENIPMWSTAVDFQNVTPKELKPFHIYMNVNMDSTSKYLFVFNQSHFVTVRHVDNKIWLERSLTKKPYKLKTLKKDLGVI